MSPSDSSTGSFSSSELEGLVRSMPTVGDEVVTEVEFEEHEPLKMPKSEPEPLVPTNAKSFGKALHLCFFGLMTLSTLAYTAGNEGFELGVPMFDGISFPLIIVPALLTFLLFWRFFVVMSPDGRTDGTYMPAWMKSLMPAPEGNVPQRVTRDHHKRLRRYRRFLYFYEKRYVISGAFGALAVVAYGFLPLAVMYLPDGPLRVNVEQFLDFCTIALPVIFGGGTLFILGAYAALKVVFRKKQ